MIPSCLVGSNVLCYPLHQCVSTHGVGLCPFSLSLQKKLHMLFSGYAALFVYMHQSKSLSKKTEFHPTGIE